ncbi:hypothetical protein LTR78_008495 [Recurvomyces mirabilis]|uniref:Short-chain dehydrogenase/reductase n=1 Tax=Recurvomyces mirabilis TaxID=574656 RepID=A0AAE0TUK9_9PEZI|nr:hypothetical protein LTR78_008495 [Recurvomyces mirabilis]KAK5156247.1 hypothetical protein LTS14_005134 [Recurvomyces mirabilis]
MKLSPPIDTKPSLRGQTVLITGANVGLGFEAALKFVQLGADKVIMGVRSVERGEQAKQEIEHRSGRTGCLLVWQLDMLDYGSVQAFAERASSDLDRLDVVVLNAGVLMSKFEKSAHGWEKTLQVNLLSTILLALLLMPKLEASKTEKHTPVLEFVSSGNHMHLTSLDDQSSILDSFNAAEHYSFMRQYDHSKLFLEYAKAELARSSSGDVLAKPNVCVLSVCPGPVKTNLVRDFMSAWYLRLAVGMVGVLQRSPEEGARTYISGATSSLAVHGSFWQDDQVQGLAPLVEGDDGHARQAKVWGELVAALKTDVPSLVV